MIAIPHLSASRLGLFLSCPRKYAFRYVEKVTVPWKSANLAFGSAVHRALQTFHEKLMEGRKPAPDEIARLFLFDWQAQLVDEIRFKDGEDADSVRAMGETLIRQYVESHQDLRVVAVESEFLVPVVDPTTGEVLAPDLKGVFDLVLEGDVLTELKTSARAYDKGTLARHLQLTAYRYAYARLHKRDAKLKVTALLKQKKPRVDEYEATRSPDDDAWFVHVAAEAVRGIEAGIFPPSPSFLCGDCEYAEHCRKWRGPVKVTRRPDTRDRTQPTLPATVAA
ncbi:MAG: PD-(D/E)XK nuclease family protein [Phycisphaerae bacterium]|nr:PD-(D/E)XK nuclease family protein [Phycisphaerae bacterium]